MSAAGMHESVCVSAFACVSLESTHTPVRLHESDRFGADDEIGFIHVRCTHARARPSSLPPFIPQFFLFLLLPPLFEYTSRYASGCDC